MTENLGKKNLELVQKEIKRLGFYFACPGNKVVKQIYTLDEYINVHVKAAVKNL